MSPLLNTAEAAKLLHVAEITISKWRMDGLGPQFIRFGRGIRYRVSDIEAWVETRAGADASEAAR